MDAAFGAAHSGRMTTGPRVFLAADHALLCDLIADYLRDRFALVGIAYDGPSAVDAVAELRPDVAILDIFLPRMNGVEAAMRMRRAWPSIRIIFLTPSADAAVLMKALRVPDASFLLKSSSASELPTAIWTALRGERYIPPIVTQTMESGEYEEPECVELTPREKQVVRLLAEGKAMKQAAAVLNVSTRTIAFHKYGVMRRLGLHSSAELIRLAVSQGLVGN
jgi:DNA-binding NarL/FixJ family response regulator